MSIIKRIDQDEICLSYTGDTQYDNCGGLQQETGLFIRNDKLVLTDGQIDPLQQNDEIRNSTKGFPSPIYLEDCESTIITFPCNEPASTVDQGKFVEIVNTCTEPITVTGLKNSDPVRFTVFDLSYRGIETYHSGNAEDQLPFTIAPFTKKKITSFFHPTRFELEHGNAGSYENMTGDSFEAKISFYPGFPILSCESMDPCDSYYTLSGRLTCTELDREPLKNISNFNGVHGCIGNPIESVQIGDCLFTSGVFTDEFEGLNFPQSSRSFIGLQNLAEACEAQYFSDDPSFKCAIALFKERIFQSSDIIDLINYPHAKVTDFENDKITGLYKGHTEVINFNQERYTGMKINIDTDASGPHVYDIAVFFNSETVGNKKQSAIFLSEDGNFSVDSFCYSSSNDIELVTNPYTPPTSLTLSNNVIRENSLKGTTVGIFRSS